jgi:tRNA-binding EMAP/Myf-like protein
MPPPHGTPSRSRGPRVPLCDLDVTHRPGAVSHGLGGYAPGLVIADRSVVQGPDGEPRPTNGLVVGKVIEVRQHPHGDRDRLAEVDIGTGEKLRIVFGGRDIVRAGSLVPVAPPGSSVPARRKRMRTRRFRGQLSNGMFCSLAEVGWAVRCPDEVALLRAPLEPGLSLDGLSQRERQKLVINEPVPGEPIIWRHAVVAAYFGLTVIAVLASRSILDPSYAIGSVAGHVSAAAGVLLTVSPLTRPRSGTWCSSICQTDSPPRSPAIPACLTVVGWRSRSNPLGAMFKSETDAPVDEDRRRVHSLRPPLGSRAARRICRGCGRPSTDVECLVQL